VPAVRLTGHVGERARTLGVGVEVSLTHSRELASAVAVTAPA
jgi:phosphopantetheinyl transferase (holo-ACP synthase)